MTHPNEFDATQDSSRDAQAFDAAARAAHADALTHVSARVQAELQQRRRAALSGRAPAAAGPFWPMLALGGSAVVALAIGLHFVREPAETPATLSIASQSNIASQPNKERASDSASVAKAATDRATPGETMPDTATAMAPDAMPNLPSATADPNANPNIDPAARDAIAANDSAIDTTMAEIEALLGDDNAIENPIIENPALAVSDDALLADLDENPDLYLWLGSDEGQADTTELL